MKLSNVVLLSFCALASAGVFPSQLNSRQETSDPPANLGESTPTDDPAISGAVASVDVAFSKEPIEDVNPNDGGNNGGDKGGDKGGYGNGGRRRCSDVVDRVARDLGPKSIEGAIVRKVADELRRRGL
ncbi:hypothetical protein HYFRA_00012864 [Hymenoscyphus fraxineus]|uniref:Uncharacterized protein n=1 Tax=Hymenoscyphus fraxineus TaxID=746836 RepID=A0A9N9L6R7_9HELO|nr:hypothetical protein HYFRA_00012864 [Hymenoscyphus fraxineus]